MDGAPRNIEEALTSPGDKLVAWDLSVRDGQQALAVFELGERPVLRVLEHQPSEQRASLTAALEARGLTVGEYDRHGRILWVEAPLGIRVWDERGLAAETSEGVLRVRKGSAWRTWERSEIAAFVAYADEDYVNRGVKARLGSGELVTVVYELQHAARAPGYSRDDLLMEAGWTSAVGSALARWAGVGFSDELL